MVVENKKVLLDLVENKQRAIITVSNHRCNIDDPLLWSKHLSYLVGVKELKLKIRP